MFFAKYRIFCGSWHDNKIKEIIKTMIFASLRSTLMWKPAALVDTEEIVLRYCTVGGFSIEGGHIDGALLFCTLSDIENYWGLFNCCVFVECRFERCIFKGTSFRSCKFVECNFVECQFVQDNLNGDCSFEDSAWYNCTQTGCVGLSKDAAIEA
jgi:hypothetical protein